MASVRNITDDTLELRLHALPGMPVVRTAEPDAVVDVPDDVFAAHAWPESVWQVVTLPQAQVSEPVIPAAAAVNEEE